MRLFPSHVRCNDDVLASGTNDLIKASTAPLLGNLFQPVLKVAATRIFMAHP